MGQFGKYQPPPKWVSYSCKVRENSVTKSMVL